jgi:ribosomal protein S7
MLKTLENAIRNLGPNTEVKKKERSGVIKATDLDSLGATALPN